MGTASIEDVEAANPSGRRTDAAGGITGIQLQAPVLARYIRVVADRPDDGGQTGGQMAISELAAYSLR